MFVFASTHYLMKCAAKQILLLICLLAFGVGGCKKKSSCPTFWAAPDNQQKASDGKKESGENLDNDKSSEPRETELTVVRVKRDKNGIVQKKKSKVKKRRY